MEEYTGFTEHFNSLKKRIHKVPNSLLKQLGDDEYIREYVKFYNKQGKEIEDISTVKPFGGSETEITFTFTTGIISEDLYS